MSRCGGSFLSSRRKAKERREATDPMGSGLPLVLANDVKRYARRVSLSRSGVRRLPVMARRTGNSSSSPLPGRGHRNAVKLGGVGGYPSAPNSR
jgi:hypothetical protein